MVVNIFLFIPIRKNNSCWQMESTSSQDSCGCVAEQEVSHFIFTYVFKNYVYITCNILTLLFEGLQKGLMK